MGMLEGQEVRAVAISKYRAIHAAGDGQESHRNGVALVSSSARLSLEYEYSGFTTHYSLLTTQVASSACTELLAVVRSTNRMDMTSQAARPSLECHFVGSLRGRQNMRDQTPGLERREFLKSGLLAAAGSAALSSGMVLASPVEKTVNQAGGTVPTKPFGKTGHTLPILGMGGSAMVQRFIAAYGLKLLSMEERIAMVRRAYDQGIRY